MYELIDKELGRIVVTPHKRAKRIIARRKGEFIRLTVPYRFNMKNIHTVLQELKPGIMKLSQPTTATITEEDVISTLTFDVHIAKDPFIGRLSLSLKEGKLQLYLPMASDISQPENQKIIKEAIIHVLRREAKRVLPEKTAFFARKEGLSYHQIRINSSRSRWGSCSAKKNINFSLFLLLLPERLIDYVVLHELAHTIEMNHGDRFWQLLERLCDGKAKMLREEVKNYSSDGYRFLIQQ
jgi:predicted metal-dependent hydrolase